MTDDREMLELAAKAAGYWVCEPLRYGEFRVCLPERHHLSFAWNPLTDDGDALRLAVKLGIDTKYFFRWGDDAPVVQADNLELDAPVVEETTHDPIAATRRAIVRAAAEIGKGV
jgi:hypothetical protein